MGKKLEGCCIGRKIYDTYSRTKRWEAGQGKGKEGDYLQPTERVSEGTQRVESCPSLICSAPAVHSHLQHTTQLHAHLFSTIQLKHIYLILHTLLTHVQLKINTKENSYANTITVDDVQKQL